MDDVIGGSAREQYVWLIPAIPLGAAAFNLFVGRRLARWGGIVGSVAVALSFAGSALIVFALFQRSAEHRLVTQHLFDWISVGRFDVG
ncbi:MAG TPA: hypothetical protein VJ887_01315, partial [Actinomycetota bacterium]|nr:hypothetical protein [Actinomycetota bacterium]